MLCVLFACRSTATVVSSPRFPGAVGRLTLFEPRLGGPESSFVGTGRDYRVHLTPTDATFEARTNCKARSSFQSGIHATNSSLCLWKSEALVSHWHLRGTSSHVHAEGRGMLSSYGSYFIGSDPQKWRTHVNQFSEVWYSHIYSGIDLIYYGHEGQVEYDFVVSPGANPDQINFTVTGSDRRFGAHLSENGDLVLSNATGELVVRRPLFYQGNSCARNNGSYKEQPGCIAIRGGGFSLRRQVKGGDLVSFSIPQYDHSQPLIIDPAVVFSTFFGGTMGDGVNSIALDSKGYIYLYGDTSSSDFPITPGAYQTHLASPAGTGSADAFVTKLSPDGSQVIWSTYLGGSMDEGPKGIALDSKGNIWLSGQTYSNDFPMVNPFQAQPHSYATGYVSELSPDGTKLLYSTYIGGSSLDYAYGIVLDSSDEPIITGYTASTDFPVVNAIQPVHGPGQNGDAFVTKFSADGSSLIFSTYLGGPSEDEATGIALDPSNNIYVTGLTNTGFPTTPNSFQPTCVSAQNFCSFIAKISASGQTLDYSTYMSDALALGITVNATGNAFVTGYADYYFQTTPGAYQTQLGGGGLVKDPDAFVTEMDPTGSSMVFSTFLGGGGYEHGYAIALDSSNNVFLTGQTDSPDFPLQAPLQTVFYGGVPSVFVSELDNTGSSLLFSTFWGGGAPGYGAQQGNAIAVDGAGNIIAAGSTLTPDFPVVNPIQSQLLGPGDAFIAKFEFTPDFRVEASPTSATVSAGSPVNYTLTLTPLNEFSQQVSLTCSGAPHDATCSVSPSTLTLDGTNTATASVTVTTMVRSGAVVSPWPGKGTGATPNIEFALFIGICSVAVIGARGVCGRTRFALISVVTGLALFVSCGGGSNGGGVGGGGTPPGTYTITVTTAGGTLSHPTKLTLIVR